uniref:Uncharacterized protein n=1 Tax=Anopheles atroparvus TaxID=41427 RepID=A0A182J8C9_ANOAO
MNLEANVSSPEVDIDQQQHQQQQHQQHQHPVHHQHPPHHPHTHINQLQHQQTQQSPQHQHQHQHHQQQQQQQQQHSVQATVGKTSTNPGYTSFSISSILSRAEPVSKKGLGVITPVASLPLSAAAAAAAAAASVSNGAGVGLGTNGTPSSQDAAMLSRKEQASKNPQAKLELSEDSGEDWCFASGTDEAFAVILGQAKGPGAHPHPDRSPPGTPVEPEDHPSGIWSGSGFPDPQADHPLIGDGPRA